MIPAPAALAKNIRSATGPELPRVACDRCFAVVAKRVLFVAFVNLLERHLLRATPGFLLPLGK